MLIENAIQIVALATPWLALIVNAYVFDGKRNAWIVLASTGVVYTALLLSAYLIEVRLDRELNVFDLNGDGVFTQDEINPAQEKAMENVVNDTGRAMAPITGAIFSILYALVVASVLWIVRRGIAYVSGRSASK